MDQARTTTTGAPSAYGVQIVAAFEVKTLPSQYDKPAKQFNDGAGTSRSDAARAVPAQQRDR